MATLERELNSESHVRFVPAQVPLIDHNVNASSFRRSRLVGWILAIVLFASFISVVIPLPGTGAPPTWTVMIYLDADNDLEDHGIDDFLEMSSVGSISSLNIVVQFDRYGGSWGYEDDTRYGDWTDCKRFLVTKGMTPTAGNATMDLGEVDMGGAGTLANFIDWAVGNYTASNYMLVIWDHGADWYGTCWDYTSGFNYMQLSSLNGELGLAYDHNHGLVFDVLAFDACAMGSVEVAYELSWCADYMLASEMYIPDDGFNYTSLQALADNPSTSPLDLCKRFVLDYSTYYYSLVGTPHEFMLNESFTLSVLDLSMIDPLATAIDTLSVELLMNADPWCDNITEARNNTQAYDAVNWDDGADLYDLMVNFDKELPASASLRVLIYDVMASLNATVLNETHGTNPLNCTVPVDRAHGLTIYYPSNEAYFDTMYSPGVTGYLQFADHNTWDDFVSYARYGWPWVTVWGPEGVDVPSTAVIEVWFNEPVDHQSAQDAFRITPAVSGTFYWVDSENKMVFVPDVELLTGTTYNVSILEGHVHDDTGMYMVYTHSWEFTTSGELIPEFGTMPFVVMVLLVAVVLAGETRRRKRSRNASGTLAQDPRSCIAPGSETKMRSP